MYEELTGIPAAEKLVVREVAAGERARLFPPTPVIVECGAF